MELCEIANIVGIDKYPGELDAIYEQLKETDALACDLELIDRLQTEHDIFGQYYDTVRKTAVAINADETRSAWVKAAVSFVMDADVGKARTVPVPKPDGTTVTDLLPLYILLPQIPVSIEDYRHRGFSEEELKGLLGAYKAGMRIVEQQTGRPGVNHVYYHWLTLFAKAAIFKTGGLQFELQKLPGTALWLRNRQTGQVVPVMVKGRFHASGIQPLGSLGYEDDTGAFAAEFSEDEEKFCGHGVYDSVVDAQSRVFLKSEWECIARPGDKCLGMHIPRGADISRKAIAGACAAAKEIALQQYPEYASGIIFCASWLLDPALGKLLGEQSKIAGFSSSFVKFPNKSTGMDGFLFVFQKPVENFVDLPENTSLQRKLKKLFLDGGGMRNYSGIILLKE